MSKIPEARRPSTVYMTFPLRGLALSFARQYGALEIIAARLAFIRGHVDH